MHSTGDGDSTKTVSKEAASNSLEIMPQYVKESGGPFWRWSQNLRDSLQSEMRYTIKDVGIMKSHN